MNITIKTNAKDIAKLIGQASQKQIRQATARSLNEIARGAKAQSARDIRQEVNLKIGDIKREIKDQRAKASTPIDQQAAIIFYSDKPMPLVKFQARRKVMGKSNITRSPLYGVSVKVKKERKVVKGAFLATMKTGKVGIFWRQGKSRLPIAERFGPNISQVASNDTIREKIRHQVETRYAQIFNRNLRFYIGKQ